MDEQPSQKCARCNRRVSLNPRYPNYLCRKCAVLEKVDEHGHIISFANIGLSGGLRILYWQDGKVIKEETDKNQASCFIDGIEYTAREARFGGIVIQKK